MKIENLLSKKTLMVLGIAATLGMSACQKHEGQMSDSAAADAPKESATLGAAFDDTALTATVKQRLGSDSRTGASSIGVETNNGIVTLTGTTESAAQKDAAEEVARNVANVKGIDNKIMSPSAMDDMSAKASTAADKVGDKVSDAMITTKVKASFASDDQVKATAINVDTSKGVVTLKGEVASDDARKRAVDIAKKVEGVKSVDDGALKVGA